jgi:hypothetical protein
LANFYPIALPAQEWIGELIANKFSVILNLGQAACEAAHLVPNRRDLTPK